jgi:REP element-mobilizing transposase RayT
VAPPPPHISSLLQRSLVTAEQVHLFDTDEVSQAILRGKYEFRRRLPHYQKDSRALFVTFRACCLDSLPGSVRDLVLRHIIYDHGTKANFHAAVVMPEHVHFLFTPLRDANGYLYSLVEILQAIKGASAHSVNRALGRSGPVWQDESFDHVLRGVESLPQKLEYIRQNPVRRGLVKRPEDYPWLWVAADT